MSDIVTSSAHQLDMLLLRTFVEVVGSGSFAQAADRLAITPSAVSGHIKRLEQAIDAALFVRTTRRMDLTEAGETLYTYARGILDLEREARAKLKGKPIAGRLRIGASEDFAGTWLPHVLQDFHRLHPKASIELRVGITADLLRRQRRERIDIVFGKQCADVGDAGVLLWQEPLVWAYSAERELDPLRDVPLAVFPEPCAYRDAAFTALGAATRGWRLVFESSSMAGCMSAALSGLAVTLLARSQLRDGLRELGRAERLPELPTVGFYAFAREATSANRALIDACREVGQHDRFGRRVRTLLAPER